MPNQWWLGLIHDTRHLCTRLNSKLPENTLYPDVLRHQSSSSSYGFSFPGFFLTCNVHAHRYPEARSKLSSVCRTSFSHSCCKMALASFVGSSCFPAYHRRSGHWSNHPAGHSTEYSPLHTSHSYKPFALDYHMCNVRSSHPVVHISRYRKDHKSVCRNRCPNQVLSLRVCCLERLFHCHLSTKVALIWLYQDLCSWKTDLWSHR